MPLLTLQTSDLVSLNIKLTSFCYFSMGANFQHHRRRRCRHCCCRRRRRRRQRRRNCCRRRRRLNFGYDVFCPNLAPIEAITMKQMTRRTASNLPNRVKSS